MKITTEREKAHRTAILAPTEVLFKISSHLCLDNPREEVIQKTKKKKKTGTASKGGGP